MKLPAKYSPTSIEERWYNFWLERELFNSDPDEREPYTIVIPPPNVTGVLHMGHMLNNTIQDLLVRRARMEGKNACWVPGTDHASIATEAKVVERLKEMGIEKNSLTREQFLEHAWEWREEHGGIILEQLKRLGASCDWRRTKFTMDPEMSEAVINSFVHFYREGLIYRGVRMVNWDPEGQTAVSDEEVIHRETNSKLYYIRYYISENGERGDSYLTIATTRPETIMADTAVAINPEDERYFAFKGKKVLIPLIDREIPVIEDDYVTTDFGTGCLKITPAHDLNDYEIGLRHNLPVIDILDNFGHLNEEAKILVGEERFEARRKIVKLLEEEGYLIKEEDYVTQVGYSERTDAVIEPRLSLQWFLKMGELAKPALTRVLEGDVQLIPDRFINSYRHWMEEVRDWCISRQLWWGQQIPAWYLPNGEIVVAPTEEEALEEAKKIVPEITLDEMVQDEDVLDTWFSSWLWPISVFDPQKPGFPDRKPNKDLSYYYPTNDLVTAPEILFFWVARMIMAGEQFCGEVPFKNVYLTGIVRDKEGQKMSKSLGNSPDPVEMMEEYGADGVRVGMLLCTSAGNDILFDISQVEQGRNFANKIWNAFRLVRGWESDPSVEQPAASRVAIEWFDNLLSQAIEVVEDHFEKFRLSDALMHLYRLFWDDFCAWYLEIIKPPFGAPIDEATLEATLEFFDKQLRLLHPFIPFITEELWQNLDRGGDIESIMVAPLPKAKAYSETLIKEFELARDAVINIRHIRQSKSIPTRDALKLSIKGEFNPALNGVVEKMANVEEIVILGESEEGVGLSFMASTTQFFVPLEGLIDNEAEIEKAEGEIAHLERFLKSVRGKLSNKRFVDNAPANVVELERKKEADTLEKLERLKQLIEELKRS